MKILYTADIHIKLGQKDVPVPWAKNRFAMFCEQFADMQKQVNLVIVGGDIFDRLPTMDELELYFDFVASIKKPCIIYSGNHEAIKKGTTFLTFVKKATNRLNPLVRIVDDYEYLADYDMDIIPYNKLKDFVDNYSTLDFHGKYLCTHVRGEIPPHVKPEIPLELLDRWETVLAGDLHSYSNSQRNILYPGSPYTTSFHRSTTETGAILFETSDGSHKWLRFNLPQLIKRTIKAGEVPVPTDFDHTMYEVEGDISDLSTIDDSELISKKVVKRSSDTSLILDPKLSMAEELREYLTFILELSEDNISDALQVFLEHQNKIQE